MTLPTESLQQGTWVKVISGASFHHLPAIRNLALVYTLAEVDCIDLAADPAIIKVAQAGIQDALVLQPTASIPILMASFNDGEDPHFRKATLKEFSCPSHCSQPCIRICPIQAISSVGKEEDKQVAIHPHLCFGCGRCEPVCPYQQIQTLGYELPVSQLLPDLIQVGVTGLEIHTQVGRQEPFQTLWALITPWIPRLEVVSISLGDSPGLTEYLQELRQIMQPLPRHLIWQADGRPMSGDIGAGTTHATLKLAKKLLGMNLPGKIQLAGGTNQYTIPCLASELDVSGVAYGSYARTLIQFILEEPLLSQQPDLLDQAVFQARQLVNQVKTRVLRPAQYDTAQYDTARLETIGS